MVSQSHMVEVGTMLCQYRQDNFLCDTIICASDKQLSAHSILLAAVSPVFKTVFESSGTAGMYQIDLQDFDSEDLEVALHFIYTGTLLVPSCYNFPGELPKLFAVLQQLGLDPRRFDGCEMKFKSSEDGVETDNGHDAVLQGSVKCENNLPCDDLEDQSEILSEVSASSINSSAFQEDEEVKHSEHAEYDDKHIISLATGESTSGTDSCEHLAVKLESDVLTDDADSEIDNQKSSKLCDAAEALRKRGVGDKKSRQIILHVPQNSKDEESTELSDVTLVTEDKKKYTCTTCGKQFVSRNILEQHQLVHTGQKPHMCGFCDKAFSMKSNLERHEKRHTGIKPHLCELCGKGFIQKTALQYHMKSHQEELGTEGFKQGEVYSCNACGLAFNRGANLRKHLQKFHSQNNSQPEHDNSKSLEKKSLLCDLCGKGFASVNSLKLHKMQHTGEKPFVCSMCDRAFVVKAQLQYHARLHTGEKPFVCQTCGKGFVGKLGLTQHVRTHTGERPYICTVCNKGFTQSTHLKGHMRSHTGEKPNICHLCGKAYKNRLDLRFHYSRIHEINITRPKQQVQVVKDGTS